MGTKKIKELVKKEIICPIIVTVVSTAILGILNFKGAEGIKTEISNGFNNMTTGNINNSGNGAITINNNNNFYGVVDSSQIIPNEMTTIDTDEDATIEIKERTIVGKSAETGAEIYAEELVNKSAIHHSTSDGYDIYFFGSMDEEYKWNGRCCVNAFSDNELQYSVVADYSKGVPKNIVQIHRNNNCWIYSECLSYTDTRVVRHYIKLDDYRKQFDTENLSYNDIVTPEVVFEGCCGRLVLFYSGEVDGDKFTDNSMNAYLIKFGDDEKIDFYYRGRFKDGKP